MGVFCGRWQIGCVELLQLGAVVKVVSLVSLGRRVLAIFAEWRQRTSLASVHGNLLLLNARQVFAHLSMLLEVLHEVGVVEVRFEAENFLGDLLILTLNALQLSLPLVEVQAFGSELNRVY